MLWRLSMLQTVVHYLLFAFWPCGLSCKRYSRCAVKVDCELTTELNYKLKVFVIYLCRFTLCGLHNFALWLHFT